MLAPMPSQAVLIQMWPAGSVLKVMPPKRPVVRGMAGVVEVDGIDLAGVQGLREVDEDGGSGVALVLELG